MSHPLSSLMVTWIYCPFISMQPGITACHSPFSSPRQARLSPPLSLSLSPIVGSRNENGIWETKRDFCYKCVIIPAPRRAASPARFGSSCPLSLRQSVPPTWEVFLGHMSQTSHEAVLVDLGIQNALLEKFQCSLGHHFISLIEKKTSWIRATPLCFRSRIPWVNALPQILSGTFV